MMFDVAFTISIPGIPTFSLVRSVDAGSAKEALATAEQNVCQVLPVSVNRNLTGVPVMTDPQLVVKSR